MSDTVDNSNVLNSNKKSLEIYAKSLDEYHNLNKYSISESGTIDKGVSHSYIILLLKIDLLSKNPALKDLHSFFGL